MRPPERARGTEPELGELLELIGNRTGITFPSARRRLLLSGIERVMKRARVSDLRTLRSAIESDPHVLDALLTELTVGETYFFREPGQFDFIRREVVPSLAESARRGMPLRVWSGACSSGEEPYSMAILLHELGLAPPAKIIGTDLSRARLRAARQAQYSRWSLRGVQETVVQRYFRPAGRQLQLAPAISSLVQFQYANLADFDSPLPPETRGTDIILCRNVLIYLDGQTIQRIAQRLLDSLAEEGWLFLGASDPLLAEFVQCDVVVTGAGVAYRRPGRATRTIVTEVAAAPVGDEVTGVPRRSVRLPQPQDPLLSQADGDLLGHEEEPRAEPGLLPTRSEIASMTAAKLAEEAGRSYTSRDYARAARLAAESVRHTGDDPAVWVVLVRALANLGLLSQAGAACSAALEYHRAHAELVYLHSTLLAEAGRHADAAHAARRALYLDRSLVIAHVRLGITLARVGDRDGARRAFANAERLLAARTPDSIVPASDGETARSVAALVRTHLALLSRSAA